MDIRVLRHGRAGIADAANLLIYDVGRLEYRCARRSCIGPELRNDRALEPNPQRTLLAVSGTRPCRRECISAL